MHHRVGTVRAKGLKPVATALGQTEPYCAPWSQALRSVFESCRVYHKQWSMASGRVTHLWRNRGRTCGECGLAQIDACSASFSWGLASFIACLKQYAALSNVAFCRVSIARTRGATETKLRRGGSDEAGPSSRSCVLCAMQHSLHARLGPLVPGRV